MPAEMEVDLSDIVDKELPLLLAKGKEKGQTEKAVEELFGLEKRTRAAGDVASTRRVAVAIVRLCHTAKDLPLLTQSLSLISKRRGQEKSVITAAVQEGMQVQEELEDREQKRELLVCLRNLTDGKLFVELERARLTRRLAALFEEDGDIPKAAELLREVQVETLAKMEKKEKVEYIEEQIRLCLDAHDYVRALVASRKINPSLLSPPDMQELKLSYYRLMVRYHTHEEDHFAICLAYQSMYNTPSVQDDEAARNKILSLLSAFVVLSERAPEQQNILRLLLADRNLSALPLCKKMLESFVKDELLPWTDVTREFVPSLSTLEPFQTSAPPTDKTTATTSTTSTKKTGPKPLLDVLHLRVTQHNIRVIAEHYKRITMARFAEQLGLGEDEAEKTLSDMVVAGAVWATIDRPAGILSFSRPLAPSETLNEWSADVSRLLSLVETTCHSIHRETMIHTKAQAVLSEKDARKKARKESRLRRKQAKEAKEGQQESTTTTTTTTTTSSSAEPSS